MGPPRTAPQAAVGAPRPEGSAAQAPTGGDRGHAAPLPEEPPALELQRTLHRDALLVGFGAKDQGWPLGASGGSGDPWPVSQAVARAQVDLQGGRDDGDRAAGRPSAPR